MKKLALALAAMLLVGVSFANAAYAAQLADNRTVQWSVGRFLEDRAKSQPVREVLFNGSQTVSQNMAVVDLTVDVTLRCSYNCFGRKYQAPYRGPAKVLLKKYDDGTVVIGTLKVGPYVWRDVNVPLVPYP